MTMTGPKPRRVTAGATALDGSLSGARLPASSSAATASRAGSTWTATPAIVTPSGSAAGSVVVVVVVIVVVVIVVVVVVSVGGPESASAPVPRTQPSTNTAARAPVLLISKGSEDRS